MKYKVVVHFQKGRMFSEAVVDAPDQETAEAIGLGQILANEKWRAVQVDVESSIVPGEKIARVNHREGYLNIYEHKNGNVLCGGMYQTEEIAKNTSKKGLKAIAHVRWSLLLP